MNYRLAAESMFISSSTMSRSIKELEQELGVSLFLRNSKKVELTRAGEIMLTGFAKLSEEYEFILSRAKASARNDGNHICIGISQEFLPSFLPYAVNSFSSVHKDVNISFASCCFSDLNRRFAENDFDIVIGNSNDLHFDGYPHRFILGNRIGIVLSVLHPLANAQRTLTLKDFAPYTFVTLPDRDAPARKNLFARCEKLGFVPKHVYAPDMPALLLMLESNQCVSILYENVALLSSKLIKFTLVDGIEQEYSVIVWKANPSKNVLDFIKYLERFF